MKCIVVDILQSSALAPNPCISMLLDFGIIDSDTSTKWGTQYRRCLAIGFKKRISILFLPVVKI